MAIYLTADWHLGDQRLDLLQRPFTSPSEMARALVQEHNQLVSPSDELIVVGDVCVIPDALELVALFQGQKTLIRGNKDRLFSDEELAPYFDRIIAEGEGLELEIAGLPLFATHYPTRASSDRFNLVGHIHTSWKVQKNMLNVGVDVHHFKPLPLARVPFYLAAIEGYYDDDVWVSDHPANRAHQGRGRAGSYFPPR